MNTYGNPVLAKLPNHLRQYIIDQHYAHYTPIDQAVWRYVMRQNYNYLKDIAYYPYIPGLKKAGISIEHIPDLTEMNEHLQKIGWGAVTVDGFIPLVAFMEFQAYHVLVIAADIRQIDHIEYTPAPDIIHESSGHAPIIAEPDYAAYLSYFGEIGSKAMFSFQDFQLYEVIRELSILKEDGTASEERVQQVEDKLIYVQNNMGKPSEMALLSRLHWWTVEYGLIGTPDNPKIYGAGLLSSIGESVSCMRTNVKKIPYTIDAINYNYDITKPQPQLFVTPDFGQLLKVLNQFADGMAFRVGGKESVEKAIACKNVCTAVYSSGLQISGVFVESEPFQSLAYLQTEGPSALSYSNKELVGHSKEHHAVGYGSPVGRITNCSLPLEDCDDMRLASLGIIEGDSTSLLFESNIEVKGTIEHITRIRKKVIMITWSNCEVKNRSTGYIYFKPTWGPYNMGIGERVVSVYCGAADKNAYEQITLHANSKKIAPHYGKNMQRLHRLYQEIRNIREGTGSVKNLVDIWLNIRANYPEDWLCSLEILEILLNVKSNTKTANEIRRYLLDKAKKESKLSKLIADGLALLPH
ncbi:aromatic amino acid hydroxylase [Olivibacter sp. CPCC 100613]|uniref:aromatic amino acid hydroxylase n=1 Tax=Olivibacter sp. CPCC 100613 TaxID=3079931 RepID=UPI002FF8FE11